VPLHLIDQSSAIQAKPCGGAIPFADHPASCYKRAQNHGGSEWVEIAVSALETLDCLPATVKNIRKRMTPFSLLLHPRQSRLDNFVSFPKTKEGNAWPRRV
jgi:hypothetical protein